MSKRCWDEDGLRPLVDILHYVFFSQPGQCRPVGRTFERLPSDVLFCWNQVLVRRAGLMKILKLNTQCLTESLNGSFFRFHQQFEPQLIWIWVSFLNFCQWSWICYCNPDGDLEKTSSGPLQPILVFFLVIFAQLSASLLLDGGLDHLFTLNQPLNEEDFVHTYLTDQTEKSKNKKIKWVWSSELEWRCAGLNQ